MKRSVQIALNSLFFFCVGSASAFQVQHVKKTSTKTGQTDWPVSGGSASNIHYSKLSQITVKNVSKLQEVWRYDTKEKAGGLETTPLIIDGVLYGYTPTQKVFALDAATGVVKWTFDSQTEFGSERVASRAQRSMAFWRSGIEQRILAGVSRYIYAIDPANGKIIRSFGDNGRIDLRENLGRDPKLQAVSITSPGVIYHDLIIVGDAEPETLPSPPGDIRAYDVRTGKMRWIFHTIPHPGEVGYETWPPNAWTYSGSANNWAGMALDEERGIVYVPTGSAATDKYGADRVGDNLFANSLVALNAETGERVWHFQGVHHDLWDWDFPAPPSLVTVTHNGRQVPAVVQTSKQGFLFVFDRITGKPLFPIEERKVPASTVPGEVTSPTQPFPTKPAPYSDQRLTEDMMTTLTPEAHKWAIEEFRGLHYDGLFTPKMVGTKSLEFPGNDGGGEWGGVTFDPQTHILYVNANNIGITESLAKHTGSRGRQVYMSQCSLCHGADLVGKPPEVPSLIDIGKRRDIAQIGGVIQTGKGRMPPFPNLDPVKDSYSALISYLIDGEPKNVPDAAADKGARVQYDSTGDPKFLDPQGYPANAAPWGTLNAINLDTGEYIWKIPFGQYPELVAKGIPDTGSENYGGSVVTAGGVLFIGATVRDKKFRAFDKATGKLLWEHQLPFSANATPAVYEVNGRQFVVIAAGGQRDPSTPGGGGVYMAFALPE
jgi:quinoprotein glucose dehydrogenase